MRSLEKRRKWFATTYSFVTNFSDNSKHQNILYVTIYARLIHSLRYFTHGKVVVVVLLFYVHGNHLRSCRDGQLT